MFFSDCDGVLCVFECVILRRFIIVKFGKFVVDGRYDEVWCFIFVNVFCFFKSLFSFDDVR